MIRIVVLVLLGANLLYFGWSHFVDRRQARLTAVPASSAAPRELPPEPAAPPPCATLGPFTDEVLADQARQQLEAAGWGILRRANSEESSDGWWVYVKTGSSTAQKRALESIQKAGMRDAFAMPDDPEFRVSVGIFSEETRAEERAARVQKLRFDALVTERHKQVTVIWFDVPGVARATLSDGRLASTSLPLEKLRIEDCPATAASNIQQEQGETTNERIATDQ